LHDLLNLLCISSAGFVPERLLYHTMSPAVRTLVDMEGSYLSANFFREIVAAESFSYDPSRPKPQFVTLTGEGARLQGMAAPFAAAVDML
jgi:hypothetical protein